MSAEATPRISVVVPTYRRPDLLQRCLGALQRQTLPAADYEIIVCDDGPSDAARQTVSKMTPVAGGPAVRYIPVTATQGPAGARNAGWRHARADVIAFTDDDTVPDPAWLAAGLAALRPDDGRAVGPHCHAAAAQAHRLRAGRQPAAGGGVRDGQRVPAPRRPGKRSADSTPASAWRGARTRTCISR